MNYKDEYGVNTQGPKCSFAQCLIQVHKPHPGQRQGDRKGHRQEWAEEQHLLVWAQ